MTIIYTVHHWGSSSCKNCFSNISCEQFFFSLHSCSGAFHQKCYNTCFTGQKWRTWKKKKNDKNRLLRVVPASANEWLLAGAKFRIPWKCLATLFLPRRDVEIKEIEWMKIQPQHCHRTRSAQPDVSAGEEWRKKQHNNNTHTAARGEHTRLWEEMDLFVLANRIHT